MYGFFNNGGSRCWVIRLAEVAEDFAKNLDAALAQFENIDEIAIVAAPLPPDTAQAALNAAQASIVAHCEKMEDRVAILDSARDIQNDNLVLSADDTGIWRPAADPKGYGAFYFPWIEVADPLGDAGASVMVPPSAHLAGVYARSDADRGVHKAPANEVLRGALGVRYPVSKILQGTLNPVGVNCIRAFDGTVKVYGARTLASDPQGDPEWTYINVRRLVNFLRESIDQGTQWVVFEPNAPDLWSKIRRNVGSFLTGVWATGALLGLTADQAFYVRCDETTNPPETRDLGQVVTEVGVAIVRPAEFVVFRLSQWAARCSSGRDGDPRRPGRLPGRPVPAAGPEPGGRRTGLRRPGQPGRGEGAAAADPVVAVRDRFRDAGQAISAPRCAASSRMTACCATRCAWTTPARQSRASAAG